MTTDLTPLSASALEGLRTEFDQRADNRLAMNAVTSSGIAPVAHNYDRARLLQHRFSVTVDNGKVTTQAHSGRCWLFSSLNVARFVARRALNIDTASTSNPSGDFELSQAYAMYYDKLERSNYFLNDAANLVRAGEKTDSQLMQFLLSDVMGDGGQWIMAMNLYKKYGAVPKQYYPETASSQNTGPMNTQLRSVLHQAVAHMAADPASIDQIVKDSLAACHRILTIHLGTPPTSFDWEWTDKDGNFHRDGRITPQEFWKKYINAGLEDYVCLVDDPRSEHPKGKKIGIEHLGNVAGGDATEYLNVPNQFMKDCARTILSEQGLPVWFGADCGPMMDRDGGQWATDLFEYGRVYGFDFDMDKEQRVRFGDSAMNHAMAFVGVDVADDGKTTNRWRVENSWGDKIANDGYFAMSDDWFTEYVFEVAVPKSMLPAEYQKAFEEPAIMLPAWDPMGTLA
ncbi:Aminopeptidase C [Bifidobacterium actinocoloniiforme DSM 22766]|uniref:Aminopeptidase n=1 Tax=Bifidobacterium actinocoloniiforme DSM 22766 TaxID=1437605 RepID=A0A086YYK7_9BIFI|nr:C1 family peptidase [Bifidobacterium actinocoloniiforme]AKV55885.1 aminopeptidase C [Bifidobacterium actinocoloniiforme DSM 22766]KFI39357.1 Aminopeptidase C [Bifidobacterium actinocoloniiforme DSM 22766]